MFKKQPFTTQPLPKTEARLKSLGFKLDRYDGCVSYDTPTSNSFSGGIVLVSREVINKLSVFENNLHFDFRTTQDSTFPNKRHLEDYSYDEWFDLFEEIAIMAAHELNQNLPSENQIKGIVANSGRKDRQYIESKGFTRVRQSFYRKAIPQQKAEGEVLT